MSDRETPPPDTPEEPRPLVSQKEVALVWLLTFGIMFLMGQVIGGVAQASGRKEIFLLEVLVLVPVLILIWRRRLPIQAVFRLYPVPPAAIGWSILIGCSAVVLLSEVDVVIRWLMPYPDGFDHLDNAMASVVTAGSAYELGVLLFTVAVIGGIAEEMLFRGFIQGALEEMMDVTRAVIVAAGMFAVMHFWPWIFLQIAMIGMLMGVLAWKSGSVLPTVTVHIVNNAVSVLLQNAPESAVSATEWHGHTAPWLLIPAVLILWYAIKAFYRLFENTLPVDEDTAPPEHYV